MPGRRWRWTSAAARLRAAGHANPEELASFLNFCGCRAVILDEVECPPPVGWQKTCDHTIFGLAAGEQLPLPAQTEGAEKPSGTA
ncbi:MAG: hypothetical protein ACLUVA_09195 [Faecalibacterium sp.]